MLDVEKRILDVGFWMLVGGCASRSGLGFNQHPTSNIRFSTSAFGG
jgi:hypothetical protein